MMGRSSAAAMPTGPPAGPNGSRVPRVELPGLEAQRGGAVRILSLTRWMHSRSLPSAAPSADKISDRLDDGSAETSRSVSPCSRVSCWRAEEPTCWPEISATTSSGWASAVRRSPTIRPCRSTTIRSASRNIWSISWQASRIVVPCSRRPMISSSTWAVFLHAERGRGLVQGQQPRFAAHGLRHRHQLALPAGQRADVARRVAERDAQRGQQRRGLVWKRVSDISSRGRSRPSMMLAAMSRLSHRARSCQTTAIPCLTAAAWSAGTRRPAKKTSPLAGTTSPAMQRTSVVLPAPFSPASATSSPVRTLRLTSSRARSWPKLTLSPETVSSGPAVGGGRRLARDPRLQPPRRNRSCRHVASAVQFHRLRPRRPAGFTRRGASDPTSVLGHEPILAAIGPGSSLRDCRAGAGRRWRPRRPAPRPGTAPCARPGPRRRTPRPGGPGRRGDVPRSARW